MKLYVICVIYAGSLNTLKQSGTLYDIQDHEEDLLWWVVSYTSLLLLRQILLFLMPGTRYCHSVLVAFEKLFKRRSGLDIRKYVFGNRVSDKWNNLPQCCI